MEKMTSKEFVHTFLDIWNSSDRRICFVLGAGASKSSGIRTGGELAKQWLDEIGERMKDQVEQFDNFKDKYKIEVTSPGSAYPEIYKERFRFDIDSGFDFINKELENAKPGYGYSVLAQIMAEKQHNIVITTNFDNLTEEALYTYTPKRPLICGHESLAVFAKPSVKRPLIVKIHRDRFFGPQSQPNEISRMNDLWVSALNNIFSASTPVFIGYGGNDGSLMGYMDQISIINNLFWCERKGTLVPDKVEKLLTKHNGKLVEIEGFDELMFSLQHGIGLRLLDKEIIDIATERSKEYKDTVQKINNQQSKSTDKEIQEAVEKLPEKAGDSWWAWELKAQAAKNSEEKESVYLEGLKHYQYSPELNQNYAIFLHKKTKNYDKAEKFYQKSLQLEPHNTIHKSNYAIFLHLIKKQYDEAEKYYNELLLVDPLDSDYNGNYAIFLRDIRKNYKEAEIYFRKSLASESLDANLNGNYAGFLLMFGRNKDAVPYLEKAFKNNPDDDLLSELWFYMYAHFEQERNQSLTELKKMICEKNARSIGFSLQNNVDYAIANGHPQPKLLQRLADIITNDAPVEYLCDS